MLFCFKAHTQKTRIERQVQLLDRNMSVDVSKPILRKRGLKECTLLYQWIFHRVSKPILRKRGLKELCPYVLYIFWVVSKPILRKRGLKDIMDIICLPFIKRFQSPYSENED